MKKKAIVIIAIMFLCFSGIASAVQITVDLDKMSSQEAAHVLEVKKNSEAKKEEVKTVIPTSPDKMEAWVNLGEKIGKAIGAICKELNTGVNDFIKTPVGKIAMVLIIWKAIGHELWSIFGGTLSWIILSAIIMWSFRFFHMPERVEDQEKEGKKVIRYIEKYKFNSNEAKCYSAAVHIVCFAIVTIACMVIVFG
ncbi:MAG: hypothetical protein NTZ97_04070 [Candidatus Moranbacteria bacterium]|nr:hypothetical protein [Candidatus Moranbacteria bacterium]